MKIAQRDKLVLGVGAVFLLMVGLYFLIVEPLAARRDKLHGLTARLQNDLNQMKALSTQYKALSTGREKLDRQVKARGRDFAPFSYLENVAKETGLTGQIESMTPVAAAAEDGRQTMDLVDIRMGGIGFLELIRFLHKLESSDKVFFVENLNIKPRYLTPHLLDVTLRLASPKTSS